jgi:hypothetical protein
MSSDSIRKILNYVNELIRSLDDLISTIKGNMILSFGWTGFLILLGLGITAVFYRLQRFANVPDLVKVGPSILTSAVAAFQIKTITVSRERLVGYRSLKGRLQNCEGLPDPKIQGLITETEEAIKSIRDRGKD